MKNNEITSLITKLSFGGDFQVQKKAMEQLVSLKTNELKYLVLP